MKDSFHYLYLGKTNEIPKDENNEEFQAIYCLEENKEVSSDFEKNSNLNYFLIVLQKTSMELDNAMENVKSDWNSFTSLNLELEFITDYQNRMTKSFRKLFNDCENETVIFKSQVVGFNEKSLMEINEAKKLILGAATKSKWNFWS